MQNFIYHNSVLEISIICILALIFGSFTTLFVYRFANDQPIIFTRSKCLHCGYQLKIKNLIPLFSWLFQRGKCSNCKTKISIRYPIIETIFLIFFLIVYFALDRKFDLNLFLFLAITTVMIIMVVSDMEYYFIPNIMQYLMAIFVTILIVKNNNMQQVLQSIGMGFVYLAFSVFLWIFFYVTTKLEAIGIDDIKFFFISGLLLGSKNFSTFILLTGLLGMLFGYIWQKVKDDDTFPFAPSICLACFICMLFGSKIDLVEIALDIFFKI